MEALSIEKQLGIHVFLTSTKGLGGKIKVYPEDFIVEEQLVNGLTAAIDFNLLKFDLKSEGLYQLCIMVKKGLDTLTALKHISKAFKISWKKISIAGLKDANALTAQFIAFKALKLNAAKLLLNGKIKIFPIKIVNEPLNSSFLLGNNFTIRIRELKLPFNEAKEAVKAVLREINNVGGVPNFFGHQRFGTVRPITHIVGKYIVKRDFEKAVLTYLGSPSVYENPEVKKIREELLETLNFKKALKTFPAYLEYEKVMLKHLVKHPKDYIGALKRLPSRLRLLFVNAYQSLLFNECLSKRILMNIPINKPLEGDWVFKNSNLIKVSNVNLKELNKEVNLGKAFLTLPIFGYQSKLSDGIQGEIEKAVLEKEEVKLKNFYIGAMPEASGAGGFRAALAKVKNINFNFENNQTIVFKFFLDKSSYATVFLRELMKPRNLVEAGF
ncbi:tRNA pseudouridine(13) synthase TruD [Candidatus Bathyarchaeota archaeon]|nr:tRNA pseudouridine(13) synthase TruD [Candidatus Bathyarchaeota archaeon]